MTFAEAVEALKSGERVGREGWPPRFLALRLARLSDGREAIGCEHAGNNQLQPWCPTIESIDTNDWNVLPPRELVDEEAREEVWVLVTTPES